MNVNVKNPQNLTVLLRTYRKRLIKELVNFSWSITKTSNISMEQRKYRVFGTTEGGGNTFHHVRLRGQSLPQGQNRTLWGQGDSLAQDLLMLVYRNQMLDVFGVLVTTSA